MSKKQPNLIGDSNVMEGAEVLDYLGKDGVVEWILVRDLLASACDACVDGRTDHPIIGNPGGDITRLAELIDGVERVVGEEFGSTRVQEIFRWYVERFGDFYLHTDDHALESLGEHMVKNGWLADSPNIDDVFAYIDVYLAACRELLIER